MRMAHAVSITHFVKMLIVILSVVFKNYEMLTHFIYLFLVKRSEDDTHKWVSKIHRTKNQIYLPLLHPEVYKKEYLKRQ